MSEVDVEPSSWFSSTESVYLIHGRGQDKRTDGVIPQGYERTGQTKTRLQTTNDKMCNRTDTYQERRTRKKHSQRVQQQQPKKVNKSGSRTEGTKSRG